MQPPHGPNSIPESPYPQDLDDAPGPVILNALPSSLVIIFQWAGYTLIALFALHGVVAMFPQVLGAGEPRLAAFATLLERAPLLLIGVVFTAVGGIRREVDLDQDESWRPRRAVQPRQVLLALAVAFLVLPLAILFSSMDVEKTAVRVAGEQSTAAITEISRIRSSLREGSYSEGQVQQLFRERPALLRVIEAEKEREPGSPPLETVTTQQIIQALNVSERQVREQKRRAIADVQTGLLARQIRMDLTALLYALVYGLFWLVWPVAYSDEGPGLGTHAGGGFPDPEA